MKLKIAFIGAGSVCFCPVTVSDIFHNKFLRSCELEIALMDIRAEALEISRNLCDKLREKYKKDAVVSATLDLREALKGADFVIAAVEVERYFYWSQDFHIPRKYGFNQIYGENGGPGGLFHTLRNMGPMLHIAKTMEELCPNALLLNYTNPEAKLVTAISRASNISVVGLCHSRESSVTRLAKMLGMHRDDLEVEVSGINHFGVFTKIIDKKTGRDLYPDLIAKDKELPKDWHWDRVAMSRILLRLYGKWVYPETNHMGEYIGWSDQFFMGQQINYFYDPLLERDYWSGGLQEKHYKEFVYDIEWKESWEGKMAATDSAEIFRESFEKDDEEYVSTEYGVAIIEAIASNKEIHVGAVNVPNKGYCPSLPDGMVVEVPAMVDGNGIHPKKTEPIPSGLAAYMTNVANITELLYEAYVEKSKKKLLQAVMLEPTVSNYTNAVAMIDEMFELQKDILPEMNW